MTEGADFASFDHSGMYRHVVSLGDEVERAWQASEGVKVPPGPFSSLVVAGMGGSAAGGDFLAAFADPLSTIPVRVVRGYALPGYVGPASLVVVVSYSGRTREALACYHSARAAQAPLVVVTRGGPLGDCAGRDGVSQCSIEYESPPRASLAHTLALLLRIGSLAGVVHVEDSDIRSAAQSHRAALERIALQATDGAVAQVAEAVSGTWPVLFAAEHLSGATRRARNQLAENAKVFASFEPMPEAAHNFVVGFEGTHRLANTSFVSFESPRYSPDVQRGFTVLDDVTARAGVRLQRLQVSGDSLLGDMLEVTAWGDCLSYRLAGLRGLDPTPTDTLDFIKGRMESLGGEA